MIRERLCFTLRGSCSARNTNELHTALAWMKRVRDYIQQPNIKLSMVLHHCDNEGKLTKFK